MTVLSKFFVRRGVKFPTHGRVGKSLRCGPTRLSINETPHQKMFRIASLNVGALRGRSREVVETVSRRGVDLCCLQEVRWRGASACMIVGKDSRYKVFWIGNKIGNGGVGILLAEEWVENVYDICMISDRLMMIKLAIDNDITTVLSCYAPQVALDNTIKDAFYDLLNSTVNKVSAAETLVICGDFNGHVGKMANGCEGAHGGHGYGLRNTEGKCILKFTVAHDLVGGNTHFHKKENHLITYKSGGNSSQIDYILVRKSDFKQVRNIKFIPGEEVVTQHRLLVTDMKWKFVKQTKKTPKLRTWKFKDQNVTNLFKDRLTHLLASDINEKSLVDQWMHLKTNLLKATEETCGISKQVK